MKTNVTIKWKNWTPVLVFVISLFTLSIQTASAKRLQSDTSAVVICKGAVVDAASGESLVFATLNVSNSNIATVCNSEGEFLIKVPRHMMDQSIVVSFLGYRSKELLVSELAGKESAKIKLEQVSVSLAEVNVLPKDPDYLIRAVMNKIGENYSSDAQLMTAFYRETIKKGRSYVSLSEAVVEVIKQPYTGGKMDLVRLFKGRKSTDYSKLDTLTFKLMGGPFSTLMLDVVKNPHLIFSNDMVDLYDFKLSNITRINDRLVYVIEFKQKPTVDDALYFGKLFIDSESYAISSASFSLNVSDKAKASDMMIRKKPAGADVFPTEANYLVNYSLKDGKWYYAYSRGQINFKVNWKKKVFNSYYNTTIEMAVTNREKATEKNMPPADRLKSNVIMEEAVSGFSDKEFWGEYNVIEPEQSIESAIRKIQRQLQQ